MTADVDLVVDEPRAALDDDHRPVVEETDALARLLALLDHLDPQLLAGQDGRLHGVGERVDVHHPHALELGDAVEVEVVGEDDAAAALGELDELRVDLGDVRAPRRRRSRPGSRGSRCIRDRMSRPRRPRLRRSASDESAMCCSSSSTNRGTTSVPYMNPDSTISAIRPSISTLVSTTIRGSPSRRAGSAPGAGRARPLGSGDEVVPLGDEQAHHPEAQEQRDAERQPGAERALDLGSGRLSSSPSRRPTNRPRTAATNSAVDSSWTLRISQPAGTIVRYGSSAKPTTSRRSPRREDEAGVAHAGEQPVRRGDAEPDEGAERRAEDPDGANHASARPPSAACTRAGVAGPPSLACAAGTARRGRSGDASPSRPARPARRAARRTASASEPTSTTSIPDRRRLAAAAPADDRPREPEPRGLAEPPIEPADGSQLAEQPHLADRDGPRDHRPVAEGRREGQRERQVEAGLRHARARRRGWRRRRGCRGRPRAPPEDRDQQGEPVGIDARRRATRRRAGRRGDQRLDLDQERPAALEDGATPHPGAGRSCSARNARAGSATSTRPRSPSRRRRPPRSSRSRFFAARRSRSAAGPVALEGQDDVDEVLEGLRPGQRAVLRHVPTSTTGMPSAFASSSGAAWTRAPGPRSPAALELLESTVWTESTTSSPGRARPAARDPSDLRLRDDLDRLADGPGPARGARRGAAPARRLLAGRVEHLAAGPRDAGRDLQQQRRLADPGLAAQQHDRPGHEAAAEDAVELADPDRPAELARRRPARSSGDGHGAAPASTAAEPGRGSSRTTVSTRRVPLAAGAALALPAQDGRAAGLADEAALGAGHGGRLAAPGQASTGVFASVASMLRPLPRIGVHHDRVARLVPAEQQVLRERVLDHVLDRRGGAGGRRIRRRSRA